MTSEKNQPFDFADEPTYATGYMWAGINQSLTDLADLMSAYRSAEESVRIEVVRLLDGLSGIEQLRMIDAIQSV